jgi:hypothetical protein
LILINHADIAFVQRRRNTQLLMQTFTRVVLLAALATVLRGFSAGQPIPPAFGPHINFPPGELAGVPSFTSTQRIVGTYFFYWYDSTTKEHIVDDDGTDALTTHPATLDDVSYRSVRWHER